MTKGSSLSQNAKLKKKIEEYQTYKNFEQITKNAKKKQKPLSKNNNSNDSIFIKPKIIKEKKKIQPKHKNEHKKEHKHKTNRYNFNDDDIQPLNIKVEGQTGVIKEDLEKLYLRLSILLIIGISIGIYFLVRNNNIPNPVFNTEEDTLLKILKGQLLKTYDSIKTTYNTYITTSITSGGIIVFILLVVSSLIKFREFKMRINMLRTIAILLVGYGIFLLVLSLSYIPRIIADASFAFKDVVTDNSIYDTFLELKKSMEDTATGFLVGSMICIGIGVLILFYTFSETKVVEMKKDVDNIELKFEDIIKQLEDFENKAETKMDDFKTKISENNKEKIMDLVHENIDGGDVDIAKVHEGL